MVDKFDAQIDKFVIDTEKKLLQVVQTAIQSTVNEAQTQVAKGGKMRVDTGFLRWSGLAALNAIPSGPRNGRDRKTDEEGVLPEYQIDGDPLAVVLGKMKLGDTFYWGWTARYAKYREMYDGFMETAIQNWSVHVNNAVARFRK